MSANEKESKNSGENCNGYYFGGIREYNLEQIEAEVLNDAVYLDVFAGSDKSLKENIRRTKGSLLRIRKLNVVGYNYIDQGLTEQIGFIAQEAVKIAPEIVSKSSKGHLQINYGMLTPTLTQSIQELATIVDKQEKRIKELEEKIESLSKK